MVRKMQRATRALAACLALFVFGAAVPAWAADQVVMGFGTFSTEETRNIVVLEPSCVQLVNRTGTVQFTGAIAGNGQVVTRVLREGCADPAQGTFHSEIQLTDATVGGVTGNLIIVLDGITEGSPTIAPGVRIRAHGTVSGISGKLRGATGLFQVVGQNVTIPGIPASAFDTYYLEIHLK